MKSYKNILVTGGCGFIGTNFINYIFNKTNYIGNIINIDKITYAGNPLNLIDIDQKYGGKRYFFEKGDICSKDVVGKIIENYEIDCVVHFAAESHVDRSITGPEEFINTNIIGTFNLLESVKNYWKNSKDVRFHHISTDEVFGSLGSENFFYEDTAYDPRSPYSASKASSDHLVRAYYYTYNIPVTVSNCSNNYGPYQFPEKLIPLMIDNIQNNIQLPVYGDGKNIRDWLYVEDHVSAVWEILINGKNGESYNIGGDNEWDNISLIELLCEIMAENNGLESETYKKLITFVKDRPGHDRRYAINCEKMKRFFNWKQSVDFKEGLNKTINWYVDNKKWIEDIKNGEYLKWIESNYSKR